MITPYAVDEEVFPLKIVKVRHVGSGKKSTLYRAQFLCCGKEVERTHSHIQAMVARGVQYCPKCRGKAQQKKRGPSATAPETPATRGAVDKAGWFWPSLTTMGFRLGATGSEVDKRATST